MPELVFAPVTDALNRKIDMRVLPLLCVFQFLAGMDRNDFGAFEMFLRELVGSHILRTANAKVAGMQTALHISNGRYKLALSIFFLGYVVFQLPYVSWVFIC